MKLSRVSLIGCLFVLPILGPTTAWRPAEQQDAHVRKASRYTVTDLNIAIRSVDHGPRGINAKGEIAGTLDKPGERSTAFLYRKGVLTELPWLDGIESEAVSINNKSQIAGVITRPTRTTSGEQIPVVWDKGRVRDLGPLPGPFGGTVSGLPVTMGAINDLGQVVGYVSGWESTYTPFVWLNGAILEPAQYEAAPRGKLASAPPLKKRPFLAGAMGFLPKGINGRGQIVGASLGGRAAAFIHAMLWHNGKALDLGVLPGGRNSRANAINNRVQVAGTSATDGEQTEHAFLWENGEMRDLGTLGGRTSEASAINNNEDIVGWADIQYKEVDGSSTTTWGGERAVLWQNGAAYNLNDLLPPNAGWVLQRAVAVNDKGQIVGVGYRSHDGGRTRTGGMQGFLLTPVPQ